MKASSLKQRIYLSTPHMGTLEQSFVQEAFDTNWLSSVGPNIDAFEREVANYIGMKGGAALSSATAAIHLALRYLGVGPGDTVICSSLTFVASINPALYLGAEPIFIDSEPTSWNMSPQALERALKVAAGKGRLPKAAVIVNLYGQSAEMDPIVEICDRYGVPIVEDAAESLGATYQSKPSGSFGKFGVLSFNGNKIITTTNGGMVVSDDLEALEKIRFWATQARDTAPHYQHSEMGYNYRMSNVLAGIGRGQLRVLDERVRARRRVFDRYVDLLGDLPGIAFMPESLSSFSTRWLTALTLDPDECDATPLDIVNALAKENIEARPVWKPMHLQPLFEGNEYYPHEKGWDLSAELFRTGICLPSGSNLMEDEILRVASNVRDCVEPKIAMRLKTA
jgi:pyridoxal phosphate-dependent aminotransferase EpsN